MKSTSKYVTLFTLVISQFKVAFASNLAALVDLANLEVRSYSKSILTVACSSITCVSLVVALYITRKYNKPNSELQPDYRICRAKKANKRYWIQFNQMVWMLVSHLLVLFGLDRTDSKV